MASLRRASALCGVVIVALTLLSCSGVQPRIAAEQPRNETFRTEMKGEVSNLNLAFEASSDELTAALNRMIGSEIYKGPTKISGVNADIFKSGPVGVTATDNYIYLTIPVTMSLRYGSFKTPPLSSKLKFKMNARITPNWKIQAEIYYMGLSDLFAEETGIGPLSIKPRSVIEGITQPLQKVISDLISYKINERYSLKKEIEKAWIAARKPVLLDKNYNAWLKITPQEVILFPISASNNHVKLSIGLKSIAELVVGPEPPATAPVPMPDLKLVSNFDKSFRIALKTDLSYKDIVKIASPLLLNRELGSDGKSIVLKTLDIYGNGDKLIIKMETLGSLEGIFYLACKPSFNPQTNIFSVEDVDFDMYTRSILLKSADWFLHSKIKNTIREKINMNLTERLEKAREAAQKGMAEVKLADHVFLKGRLKDLKLHDVVVQKDKISIQVYTEGESSVVFQ